MNVLLQLFFWNLLPAFGAPVTLLSPRHIEINNDYT